MRLPLPRSTLFPYTTLFRSNIQLLGDTVATVVDDFSNGFVGMPMLAVALIGFGLAFREYKRTIDRKSTRLNSSHVAISYAVFCLKKKNTIRQAKSTRELKQH